MKVILLEDVKTLGRTDDIVEVSPGYANNFLFKKKLALEATAENLNVVRMRKKTEQEKALKEYEDAVKLSAEIDGKVFELPMKCGDGNRLYGAVTGMDVARIIESAGYRIDKRSITIQEHIKTLGVYDAEIKLHSKVTAGIRLNIVDAGRK